MLSNKEYDGTQPDASDGLRRPALNGCFPLDPFLAGSRWQRLQRGDSVEEVWFEVIAVPLIGGLGEAGEQRAA
jgi:hypothetical protein